MSALNPLRLPDKFEWSAVKGELEDWVFKHTLGQVHVPPGTMVEYGNSTPPDGWLEIDGQALLVEDYPDLSKVLGYTYGGAGATFSLPAAPATTVGQIWIVKV